MNSESVQMQHAGVGENSQGFRAFRGVPQPRKRLGVRGQGCKAQACIVDTALELVTCVLRTQPAVQPAKSGVAPRLAAAFQDASAHLHAHGPLRPQI